HFRLALIPPPTLLTHRCPAFFFSSRRRHTRSKRDWSSDVCSSDLVGHLRLDPRPGAVVAAAARCGARVVEALLQEGHPALPGGEIGRASCRERVETAGGEEGVRKQQQRQDGRGGHPARTDVGTIRK